MGMGVERDDIYTIVLEGYDSQPPAFSKYTGASNILQCADQLPPGPLVVLSPETANHLAGTESLYDFEHPEDAIYVFGADNISIHPKFFGDREIDHAVYIPIEKVTHINSHVTAAMVLYDRRHKEWLTR
jgi:tRNA(Leu) C34 or U34 (ribose-2'-O)-methylase TrmL